MCTSWDSFGSSLSSFLQSISSVVESRNCEKQFPWQFLQPLATIIIWFFRLLSDCSDFVGHRRGCGMVAGAGSANTGLMIQHLVYMDSFYIPYLEKIPTQGAFNRLRLPAGILEFWIATCCCCCGSDVPMFGIAQLIAADNFWISEVVSTTTTVPKWCNSDLSGHLPLKMHHHD